MEEVEATLSTWPGKWGVGGTTLPMYKGLILWFAKLCSLWPWEVLAHTAYDPQLNRSWITLCNRKNVKPKIFKKVVKIGLLAMPTHIQEFKQVFSFSKLIGINLVETQNFFSDSFSIAIGFILIQKENKCFKFPEKQQF